MYIVNLQQRVYRNLDITLGQVPQVVIVAEVSVQKHVHPSTEPRRSRFLIQIRCFCQPSETKAENNQGE